MEAKLKQNRRIINVDPDIDDEDIGNVILVDDQEKEDMDENDAERKIEVQDVVDDEEELEDFVNPFTVLHKSKFFETTTDAIDVEETSISKMDEKENDSKVYQKENRRPKNHDEYPRSWDGPRPNCLWDGPGGCNDDTDRSRDGNGVLSYSSFCAYFYTSIKQVMVCMTPFTPLFIN